jgi:hypothetical protein
MGQIADALLGAIGTVNMDAGIGVGNGGGLGGVLGHGNPSVV